MKHAVISFTTTRQTARVDVIRHSADRRLFVHASVALCFVGTTPHLHATGGFQVSHGPTGWCVAGPFAHREFALEVFEELAKLDWEHRTLLDMWNAGLPEAVAAVVKRVTAAHCPVTKHLGDPSRN